MILEKKLTIYEILKELDALKMSINNLATKLRIKTVPLKTITYKEIITKTSYKPDLSLLNLIKAEELRDEIKAKTESYYDYKQRAIDEIWNMIENKTVDEMIVFYRDCLKWKWSAIANMVNYNERHCRRKYNEYKKAIS